MFAFGVPRPHPSGAGFIRTYDSQSAGARKPVALVLDVSDASLAGVLTDFHLMGRPSPGSSGIREGQDLRLCLISPRT